MVSCIDSARIGILFYCASKISRYASFFLCFFWLILIFLVLFLVDSHFSCEVLRCFFDLWALYSWVLVCDTNQLNGDCFIFLFAFSKASFLSSVLSEIVSIFPPLLISIVKYLRISTLLQGSFLCIKRTMSMSSGFLIPY